MQQFRPPTAAASAAATFIVKTLARHGRARLCAEPEQQLGPLPRLTPNPQPKRRPAHKAGKRTTAKKRPTPAKRRSRAGR
ncbi:MAG: hypothetical protein NZM11_01530 [Anaerolineales bacterium]|nr:hypothetical protein [Anaerolineales bacterium]